MSSGSTAYGDIDRSWVRCYESDLPLDTDQTKTHGRLQIEEGLGHPAGKEGNSQNGRRISGGYSVGTTPNLLRDFHHPKCLSSAGWYYETRRAYRRTGKYN